MKPRVLVSDKLSESAVGLFRDRGVEVDFEPGIGRDKDALRERIGDYDGLAIRSATKVTEKLLGGAGRLTIFGIADRIAMDRGGTSRSVARLEKRGLILRRDDPSDRRRSHVELTNEGRAVHDEIARFALAREQRLLRNFSAGDSARLRRYLNALVAEADAMIAEGWAP